MGKLRVMDRSGDTTMTWDPKVEESVEAVKVKFDEMIRKGFIAYATDTSLIGTKQDGVVTRKFDPQVETIVMASPLVGG